MSVKVQPRSIEQDPAQVKQGKCVHDVSRPPLAIKGEGNIDAEITYSYTLTFK